MRSQPEKVFLFRLALKLGMTVSRLLDEVDSREIRDWMAFFRMEAEDREEQEKNPAAAKGDIAERLKSSLSAWNKNPESKQVKTQEPSMRRLPSG